MEHKELEDFLQEVNYSFYNEHYQPSIEAIQFINFIKLVNGAEGEENASPAIHLKMIDGVNSNPDNVFVSFRGSAKTSVLHEYMFLFLATYNSFFDFGTVEVAMYVSDTIDNGVKNMRKNLENRYNKSEFMQKYVPQASFTDVRWEFKNLDNKYFVVRGFGASTGVRGFKEYGKRPTWCAMDDLMSDKNAESPTIIRDIRNIIFKAARQAMHPKKRKVVWSGTPFNKKDPLYSIVGSGAFHVTVFPICEKFPCSREEFKGAWEDRFNYDFVLNEYNTLKQAGEIEAFNQELMLRIVSDDDRLIKENDISYYVRKDLIANKDKFNFYITTDFATSEKESADYSAMSVWAVNSNKDYFWVDGVCAKQHMGNNVDQLFKLVQTYNPMSVGVEVSGQQGGFIAWLKREMMAKNTWFALASHNNSNNEGIRPSSGKKLDRFQVVVPLFKQHKIHLPTEMKEFKPLIELEEELSLVTPSGFKSKHDDMIDTVSMLGVMEIFFPSVEPILNNQEDTNIWGLDEEDDVNIASIDSYII